MSFICRLCLSTLSDRYEKIEKIDQKQFQIVLPEIDFAITDSPVICTNCISMLQTSYLFKTNCLRTEKLLQSYIEMAGEENLTLSDLIKDQCMTIKQEEVKVEMDQDEFIDDTKACGAQESIDSHETTAKLQCPICSEWYKSTHLNNHIAQHLNLEKEMDNIVTKHLHLYSNANVLEFLCSICQEKAENLDGLIKHVKSHFVLKKSKSDEPPVRYTCEFCTKSFGPNDDLITHIKTHFQRSLCKVCKKSFSVLSSLKKHLVAVHETTEANILDFIDYETDEISMKEALSKYSEKLSPDKYESEEDETQFTLNTNRPFKCNLCPKSYAKKSQLTYHSSAHRSRPKCTICCKVYLNIHTYRRHMMEVHKVNIGTNDLGNITMVPYIQSVETVNIHKFKCDICGKTLRSNRGLLAHKLAHIRNKNVACHHCNIKFLTGRGLTKHINAHHRENRPEQKPRPTHTCEICGITTKVKKSLEEHMRIHTGERPHKCNLCEKSFTQYSSLFTHKKAMHSDDFPFTCEYCSKRFKVMGSLKKHINAIHIPEQVEKKFKCTQCDKKFSVNSKLKTHMKRHSEERDKSCDICGKRFLESSEVRKHRVIHFNEKKHKCEICGKGFHQKYNIKKHMRVHIQIE